MLRFSKITEYHTQANVPQSSTLNKNMLVSSKVGFVCQQLVNPVSQCDIKALTSCKSTQND